VRWGEAKRPYVCVRAKYLALRNLTAWRHGTRDDDEGVVTCDTLLMPSRSQNLFIRTGTLLLIIMSHARHLCDTVTSSSDTLYNIVQSRSKTQWPVSSL